jgi:hypothetical protein
MASERNITGLLGDFRVLLLLFVGFRVLLLLAYEPFLLPIGENSSLIERGIGTSGDRLYHFALAALEDDGFWPFRDWWSEFPPVWFLTTTSVHALLGENVSYNSWSIVLGLIMLASETGSLILLYKLGGRLHNTATGLALAWIYALLAIPFVFMWWNFDSLVTFTLLLGIWLLLIGQETRSAAVVAFGALVKFVPALLFGAILRYRNVRSAGRYIAVTLGLFALAYLPLFAINAELTAVSLTAQFGKPSYQTVWAILDGNTTTGNFGSIESHFYAKGVAEGGGPRNPALLPAWLRFGVAGLIGLFVFLRTRRFDDVGLVAFVGITLLIFFLQSQGFSPQWLTQIIPLYLLVFPTRNAVYLIFLLSLLAFVEYPFLFARTGDTGGVISGDLLPPYVLIVGLRTLLMVLAAVTLYGKLRQERSADQAM